MGFWKLHIAFAILAFLVGCDEDEATKQIGSGPAQLVLEIAELRHQILDGRHTYFHKRKYSESGGTGVTLQIGKVCVENGESCLSARVNYRIDGGQSLEQSDHLVATQQARDTITIEYWGKDDAGNDIRVMKTLFVESDKVDVR